MADLLFFLVPEPGVEPGCSCERGILSRKLKIGDFPSNFNMLNIE